mmetsp:Transcript_18489/g.46446  ORF Transcript_18489/g.46446 Transcript_18489/m.46446 type:complete len:123 (-) Transcript_18489:132-500(-)
MLIEGPAVVVGASAVPPLESAPLLSGDHAATRRVGRPSGPTKKDFTALVDKDRPPRRKALNVAIEKIREAASTDSETGSSPTRGNSLGLGYNINESFKPLHISKSIRSNLPSEEQRKSAPPN